MGSSNGQTDSSPLSNSGQRQGSPLEARQRKRRHSAERLGQKRLRTQLYSPRLGPPERPPAPRSGLGGSLREAGLRSWRAATGPPKIPALPGPAALTWAAKVWGRPYALVRAAGPAKGGRRHPRGAASPEGTRTAPA